MIHMRYLQCPANSSLFLSSNFRSKFQSQSKHTKERMCHSCRNSYLMGSFANCPLYLGGIAKRMRSLHSRWCVKMHVMQWCLFWEGIRLFDKTEVANNKWNHDNLPWNLGLTACRWPMPVANIQRRSAMRFRLNFIGFSQPIPYREGCCRDLSFL